jgi:LysM repeat protein
MVSRLVLAGVSGATLVAAVQPLHAEPNLVSDSRGPVVSILQPQYNDLLKGSVPVLIGVETRKFTPSTIEMYVDGRPETPGPISLTSLPSSNFTWNTTKHPDGPHKLTVVVTDTQGFRGSSEVTIYINNNRERDLTPPALKWMSSKNGDTWRGIVNIELKVVDNFGVKYLFVFLNPASEPMKKPAKFSWIVNRPPYSIKFDSRKAPDGLYALRATAYDSLENEGHAPTLQVQIGNNAINPTYNAPSLVKDVPAPVEESPLPAPDSNATNPSNGDVIALSDTESDAKTASSTQAALPPRSAGLDRLASAETGRRNPVATSPSLSSTREGSRSNSVVSAPARQGSERSTSRQAVAIPPLAMLGQNALRPSLPASTSRGTAKPSARIAATPKVKVTSPTTSTAKTPTLPSVELGQRSAVEAAIPQTPQRVALTPAMAKAVVAAVSSATTAAGSRIAESQSSTAKSSAPVGARFALPPVRLRPTPGAKANGKVARGIAPLNPASLQSASGTTDLSSITSSTQGSVSAPYIPNPNLNAGAQNSSQRATLPAIAALPALSTLKSIERAAITVAPSDGSIVSNDVPSMHVVQRNETLAAVANRYKLPIQVVAEHNKLRAEAQLTKGQKVLLPRPLLVTYQGKPVTGDVASLMVGSTGVTAFRFMFEKQGGTMIWDEKNQAVIARNDTHEVMLKVGSKTATVNRKEVMMDLAAFLLSGRTMVPIRFFEKALQAKVEWEPSSGRLFVAMAN